MQQVRVEYFYYRHRVSFAEKETAGYDKKIIRNGHFAAAEQEPRILRHMITNPIISESNHET